MCLDTMSVLRVCVCVKSSVCVCVKACACKRIYALKVSACKCPAKKHLCVKASAYKSACVCVSVCARASVHRSHVVCCSFVLDLLHLFFISFILFLSSYLIHTTLSFQNIDMRMYTVFT